MDAGDGGTPVCSKRDVGFSIANLTRVLVGDGRGDGILRVYAGDDGGRVAEFEYASGTDSWKKTSFGSNSFGVMSIAAGAGRLFVGGSGVYEAKYQAGAWSVAPIVLKTGYALAYGAGRGDATDRLYIGDSSAVSEMTLNGSTWTSTASIPTSNQTVRAIVIGKARNDGTDRLYFSANDHAIEAVPNTPAWDLVDCGAYLSGTGGLVLGPGRNDGINRLYSGGTAVEEAWYEGPGWDQAQIVLSLDDARVTVGAGRNDGVQHVYASTYDLNTWTTSTREYTYSGGSWTVTGKLENSEVTDIVVGAGRNDLAQRIYAAIGTHVYEYTCW